MSHNISLKDAVAMTHRYREHREHILQHPYQHKDCLPLCETFDRSAIEELLARPGCEAFRIYYGMDEELRVHAILVGVDADNKDILPIPTQQDDEEDGYTWEQSIRCPPACPPVSPLNEE